MKTMITEIAIIGAVVGAVTVADQQNLFGGNVEKRWFWERPPFVPVPVAPARYQNRFYAQPTAEQKIKTAQASIGNAQREIYQNMQLQLSETRLPLGQSKYQLTGGN